MPGPEWSDDDPADAPRIAANMARALQDARTLADQRTAVTAADLRRWHTTIYDGCRVPSPSYVGTFRGDVAHPDDVDYEVRVGPDMPDGYPERTGVWAAAVSAQLTTFFGALDQAFGLLDTAVAPGARPARADELGEIVGVVAAAHGEWLRIHPFVNGNGRTARLLAAHVALRYGLPVFVTLEPRPHDVAYARAAKQSMGRPPLFAGDHRGATAVFTNLLALRLLNP